MRAPRWYRLMVLWLARAEVQSARRALRSARSRELRAWYAQGAARSFSQTGDRGALLRMVRASLGLEIWK